MIRNDYGIPAEQKPVHIIDGIIAMFLIILLIVCVVTINMVRAADAKVHTKYNVYISSYNPLPEQTDGTPFQTGTTYVRHGIVAANAFPLGTKIWIQGFGKDYFVVEDRTASKHKNRVDIFCFDKKWSDKWGLRKRGISYVKPITKWNKRYIKSYDRILGKLNKI